MGPLDVLESIAEVPDQQVAKTGQIVYLLTFFFFCQCNFRQASTITAEAILLQRKNREKIS